MGINPTSIGFWSGIVEATFMLTEGLFAPVWAIISDRYGRKPTMMTGLFIRGSTGILSGFSTSLGSLIFMRNLVGIGGGIGAVNRTIVGEICGTRHLVKGFSLFSPAILVGNALG